METARPTSEASSATSHGVAGPGWRARALEVTSSLKFRLGMAGAVSMIVGVTIATLLLFARTERDTLEKNRERELSDTARTAALLSRRVVELQRSLEVAATRVTPEVLGNPDKLVETIGGLVVLRNMFTNVYVAGLDGRVKVAAEADKVFHPPLNLSDRSYFQRTLAERRPMVSEPLPGRLNGEPLVVFTYPLRGANGVYGVIGGSLNLSKRDLLVDLTDGQDNDSAALVVVTDAKGRVIAHPSLAMRLQPLSKEPRLTKAFAEWAAIGSPVEPAGLRLTQPNEMVSAAGVAGPDWMVWRVRAESDLLAPLRTARQQGLVLAVGLMVFVSTVMHFLLTWLLRPLQQLKQRAQHLFDGHLDAHAGWPDVAGEIGQLSRVLRHVGAERAQLEAFNSQVLKRLASVMNAAPVGIAFTRAQRFELVSAEFCRLFGHPESDLLGQPAQMIYVSNEDYLAVGPKVIEAFKAGRAYEGEWQMLRADGQRFWAQLRGRPVDASDPQLGTIWTLSDVTEQVNAREQLEWSATHDPLTGLANRKVFEQRLTRVFDARPLSLPTEVVMIDLDHFKPINDQAGHAAGDAMLKAVAGAITSRVRASDLAVRTGGDEFALLLERCSPEVSARIAESVRLAITEITLPWNDRMLRVGASLGVATLTADTPSVAAWLADADAACYEAKAAGRGTVRVAGRPALRVVGS